MQQKVPQTNVFNNKQRIRQKENNNKIENFVHLYLFTVFIYHWQQMLLFWDIYPLQDVQSSFTVIWIQKLDVCLILKEKKKEFIPSIDLKLPTNRMILNRFRNYFGFNASDKRINFS